MSTRRREFLRYSSLMGAAPMLAAFSEQATAASAKDLDPGVYDFWTSKVRTPYTDFVNGRGARAPEPRQPEDSTFLFASKKGLVPAGTLTPGDIDQFPQDGNKDISVHVERFRPSPADQIALANLQTGTLRIDVKQVKPLIGLPEALAWTAMATLASQKKGQSVPTLDNIKFDPGTLWGQFQTIPLTDGLGFWSWNFFMKKREGFWGQLLDQLFKTLDTVQPLLPLLGLPGIAVSGLKYVDQIVGGIQAQGQSQWMFKGLDIAVCATNKSYDAAGAQGARKLLLTNGTYIITTESSVSKFDKNLTVQDGLLVPPNTDPLKIYDAAKAVASNVSYMTVSVTVADSKTNQSGQNKQA